MRCPACGSDRTRRAFGDRTGFLRCDACRSLFETNPLSADELKTIYEGKSYFVKDDEADDAGAGWGYSEDYLAEQEFIEAKFDRVLGHLERYVDPGRLLDVGCGPGFLLNVARRRGWDVVGLDLNPWATSYASSQLGLDVRTGVLDEDAFAGETFDAVTMMDMVEHVSDPDGLLAQVGRLVRPGGAVALLTPDAGSPVSRALGHRWPEVKKPGEHTVLFSVKGLAATLRRHGFVATGWHSVGKTAPVATLIADVSSAAPGLSTKLRDVVGERGIGRRPVEFDPRTKYCLYARKLPAGAPAPEHLPARLPRRPARLTDVDGAILDELRTLDAARRRAAWLFDEFAAAVPGAEILEVGAGIGTFTALMRDAGARRIVAVEPDPASAEIIERELAGPTVEVRRAALPDFGAGVPDAAFDLVVCQNVLEHIGDDGAAVRAMAAALRPGGELVLVAPADPALFGALDDAYGHWRRYTAGDLGALAEGAGLEVVSLRSQNAIGRVGWWLKGRRPGARIGKASMWASEVALAAWRPIEERVRPSSGLTLVCRAKKPLSST